MQYPSQQYVESFLEPFYAPITQGFYGAFQQMRRGTIDSWPTFRPRSRASIFHDYLTQNLKALLAGHLNIRYAEQRGMTLWVLHDEIALRIKKLNDKNLSSNHYTQQSFSFVNQQFLLPGVSEIISLNLGYRINEFWTKIDGIYIICPLGTRKILWVINLDDKISNENNITVLPAPEKEEEEERRGQVRPKNRDISEGEKDNAAGGHQ